MTAIACQKNSRYRLWLRVRRSWRLYLMMLPAITYLLLFHYKPMYGILIAFKTYKMKLGIWGSPWCGIANFERLFSSYWFPIILRNTVTLSGLSLVLGFPVPVILALMGNEIGNPRLKKLFQTVSYAPHFISTVVVCGMILMFLSPSNGVINRAIVALGGEPVFFMQNAAAFPWIYVLSGLWQNMGWSAIIYFAALSGVSSELLEAAQIDGATRLQRILYINLPTLLPTMTVLFILSCGSILGVGYEKVYLLQNSANLTASEVISTYVYKLGLEKSDFAFSTATGLFNSLVNCAILLGVNTLARRMTQSSLW